MSIRIIAQGLNDLERFMTVVPDVARRAATLAINQTAERKGIQALRAQMEDEVAFPPRYLADKRRFGVTKRATKNDLEAIITGRQRPTSLARFASGNAMIGSRGGGRLSVRVNPGARKQLPSRAFLIRLRAGEGAVRDDAFNLGLAIRLKAGERVTGKKVMVPFGGGLYLLYGPSVDQVFRTVSAQQAPRVADLLTDEFLRQFNRLIGER
jgi:hypothetical protein